MITHWNTVSRTVMCWYWLKNLKSCNSFPEQRVIFGQCLFYYFDINRLLNLVLCARDADRWCCCACLQAPADGPCTDLRTKTSQTTVTRSLNVTDTGWVEIASYLFSFGSAGHKWENIPSHRSCTAPSTCGRIMAQWIIPNYVCVWKTTPVQSE